MKVLAVDGEAMSREALVHSILEAAPYAEVVTCSTASEALALPDVASFDAAFVDIGISGMDGENCIGLAYGLKALNSRMNVVYSTGCRNREAGEFAVSRSVCFMKLVTADAVAAELNDVRFPPALPDAAKGKLFVRCFGNFEVFADGRALAFRRSKAKELFAFLVDRRGAVVSLREAEAAIWESMPPSGRYSGSYLRTLVADLRQTLVACGHGDVLVRRRGELGVDATRITCDYYDYLRGDPSAINRWRGEYMAQYAWADSTAAALNAYETRFSLAEQMAPKSE